ncbi:DNA polymerase epsilon subunit 2 [Capsaspora owczarzaki ATCC 30864]|uniref:DNA polymerase II subunit 2 n=1 Tax=Capsaspora owczarzaki (strain ATCC 30864) TaxID=595528 RepID=A0A0D2X0F2_CAPO3|nr:DNA polymerase epsilon subunit 2 [Capsaspora owczarzaki ATCC 30864]KJE88954.1 DNA polymerase epsilon subunit 2 [Capsaspora owczarzaki ATCC 30864]|eukprot:XP_004365392.1 DNA polymerase epsilon subunit 2 [Capsaspora owczarzaki ATCC 30864]
MDASEPMSLDDWDARTSSNRAARGHGEGVETLSDADRARLRARIVAAFKLTGLALKAESVKLIQTALIPLSPFEWDAKLGEILRALERRTLDSSVVDGPSVQRVLDDLAFESVLAPTTMSTSYQGHARSNGANVSNIAASSMDRLLTCIDAFSVPKLAYNADRKTFQLVPSNPMLHSDAASKAAIYADRFALLKQRTLRAEHFLQPIVVTHVPSSGADDAFEQKQERFSLTPLDALIGAAEKDLQNLMTFGMLTQMEEGKLFLEDAGSTIELDLSQLEEVLTGIFTENCFVLTEGEVVGKVLKARWIGLPASESRETARKNFSAVNFFGGNYSIQDAPQYKVLERQNEDAFFVVLSDVWLDQPKTMEKLRVLFTGYASSPPVAFILIGDFTSPPYGRNHAPLLKQCLTQLGKLVAEFSQIKRKSRFVFVPGNNDPGPGNILPRPGLSASITEGFRELVPNVEFGSNPCRLRYCTQEIVIFREDLLSKMRRNCILPTPEKSDVSLAAAFTKTVIDQAHLCPLPLHVRPVYWDFDHALRIYPAPDVLILADKAEPYDHRYNGCVCLNPGSFVTSGFKFYEYQPATRRCEASELSMDLSKLE